MKKLYLIFVLCCSTMVFATHNYPLFKAFQLSIKPVGDNYVAVIFNIAPGYNIPQDKIKIKNISSLEAVELNKPIWPDATLLTNKNGKSHLAYEGQTKILIPILKQRSGKLALQIDFQGCKGIDKCYEPHKITQNLDLNNLNLSHFSLNHNRVVSRSETNTFANNSPEVSMINYDAGNRLEFIFVGLVIILVQVTQALWKIFAKKKLLN